MLDWGVSAAETEVFDDGAITLNVLAHEVVQQAAALSDQGDQRALGVDVFPVLLQVSCKVCNSEGEHGDLPFGAASIFSVLAILGEELLFFLGCEVHVEISWMFVMLPGIQGCKSTLAPAIGQALLQDNQSISMPTRVDSSCCNLLR